MLVITDTETGRRSDYTRAQLAEEAKRAARLHPDGDGKARAWRVAVDTRSGHVWLQVDILDRAGEPGDVSVAL